MIHIRDGDSVDFEDLRDYPLPALEKASNQKASKKASNTGNRTDLFSLYVIL